MPTTTMVDPIDGRVRHWRCGRIETQGGRLRSIHRCWLPRRASLLRVWYDTHYRRGPRDRCVLHYHQPWGSPGFLVVDYLQSGPGTTLQTLRGALLVLDEVARRRRTLAVVAHVATSAITDRLLRRWGWQPHLQQWSGRHWIKRYYDGYPEVDLTAYLPPAGATAGSLLPSRVDRAARIQIESMQA